jgi:hypothetical protein
MIRMLADLLSPSLRTGEIYPALLADANVVDIVQPCSTQYVVPSAASLARPFSIRTYRRAISPSKPCRISAADLPRCRAIAVSVLTALSAPFTASQRRMSLSTVVIAEVRAMTGPGRRTWETPNCDSERGEPNPCRSSQMSRSARIRITRPQSRVSMPANQMTRRGAGAADASISE